MMSVRELAAALKASPADVMKQAAVLNIDVYSALTQLDADDASMLKAHFLKRSADEIAAMEKARQERRGAKTKTALDAAAERFQKERTALEIHLQKAREAERLASGVPVDSPVVAEPVPVPVPTPVVVKPVTEIKIETVSDEKPVAAKVETIVKPEESVSVVAPAVSVVPSPVKAKPDAVPAKAKPARTHEVEEEDESLAKVHVPNVYQKDRGGKAVRDRAAKPTRDEGGRRDFGFAGGHRHAQIPDKPAASQTPDSQVISLQGAITVKELAEKMGARPNRLIADLMQMNVLAAINQRLEPAVAEKIAAKYGFKTEIERTRRSTDRKPVLKSENADDDIPEDSPESLVMRPPVVTFLGHVDHGKTSLMDRIRNTKVAAGEAGGITQHIGAYTVDVSGRAITFLDTPGHAAFSAMRARGASLTDIAVIIIAADDGIMPQTREVIKQARQADVQIMVAVNKCDLPQARPDRVKQMLQAEGLTPEEWGGDVVCCEVSAATGAGIDHLLEMILLQADVLELTANPTRRANGSVIEAQIEQGLGPTATLLVTGGTLHVGDVIICGEYFGKIRGLIDERGVRVKSAGPSIAVKCMGLSGIPEAGSEFRVMLNEKRARELAEKAAQERKEADLTTAQRASMADWVTKFGEDGKPELAVIVKADTQGSAEAIVEALGQLKSEKVTLNIVSHGIGNIAPTDVQRAAGGKAMLIGFHVSCEPGVQSQARHDGVRVNTFRIIYELIEHIRQSMLDMISPEYREIVKGHAEIRVIFDIGKKGRIAGCQMLDGSLRMAGKYRIYRKKEIVYTGKVGEMRHFQKEVSEITGSQECGLRFDGFEQFQEGDLVECYEMEMLPKTL